MATPRQREFVEGGYAAVTGPGLLRISPVTSWLALIGLACAEGPAALAVEPESTEEQTRTATRDDPMWHMEVTGTRILRRDFSSASPIVTVSPELFQSVGAATVEAALNLLPQTVPSFGSTSNNPSFDGQAFVDLRGLGPTATLVLLDGRRMIPSNGSGIVDVNLIPPTLIERVEIVTGGASAVYGSDAVAGVANFRLRQSFEGVEVGGFYGQTDRNDGEQWDVHLTAGTVFAGGRGSVYGFVGRSDRELVTQADRGFSRYALEYVGPGQGTLGPERAFIAAGSFHIEEGGAVIPPVGPNPISRTTFDEIFATYGYAPGSIPLPQLIGFNADGTLFTAGTFAPGSVANFRGTRDPAFDTNRAVPYNFAPENALQLPLERTSAFGRLSFEVSDSLRLYAVGLYGDYTASQQLAPTPVDTVFMPPGNPFIPDDLAALLASRPNPNANFQWIKRVSELGPRIGENDYDVYQATLGADGFLTDEWRFNAYLQQGRTRQTRSQSGNALRSRIEELTFAPDGGVAACGGFDVFGIGSISPECAAYISTEGKDHIRVQQFIAEASVEGPLAQLPAGELRAAFGLMHKRDEFSYKPDDIAGVFLPGPPPRSDIVGFNPRQAVSGDDDNTDLYIELLLPLLADRLGNPLLEAGLGYRHSRYDISGGADAYKIELMYRPTDTLSVRGSYQRAIRAPSITQLFSPQLPGNQLLGPARDPCEAGSAARSGPDAAAVESLCIAQGIPVELMPTYVNPGNFGASFSGGNPDLQSEEADTWTAGLVWTPALQDPRFGRLQTSIDWYRIKVDDAIRSVSAAEIISLCFDPTVNPQFSPTQPWCTFFSRDTETGNVVDMYAISRNLAQIETSGIDLQVDWQLPLGPGTLGVNWLLSWLDYYERGAGAGAPVADLAGLVAIGPGTALPEWKSLLRVNYAWRDVSVTARARYISSMTRDVAPEFDVPSRSYLDLFAGYDFSGVLEGLWLGAGIENLTDRDPPIIPGGPANTESQQFDVLGRRYFVSLRYRF